MLYAQQCNKTKMVYDFKQNNSYGVIENKLRRQVNMFAQSKIISLLFFFSQKCRNHNIKQGQVGMLRYRVFCLTKNCSPHFKTKCEKGALQLQKKCFIPKNTLKCSVENCIRHWTKQNSNLASQI